MFYVHDKNHRLIWMRVMHEKITIIKIINLCLHSPTIFGLHYVWICGTRKPNKNENENENKTKQNTKHKPKLLVESNDCHQIFSTCTAHSLVNIYKWRTQHTNLLCLPRYVDCGCFIEWPPIRTEPHITEHKMHRGSIKDIFIFIFVMGTINATFEVDRGKNNWTFRACCLIYNHFEFIHRISIRATFAV